MYVTPDKINPFYPFRAGPNDFVEPNSWLTGLVDVAPIIVGKLPLGMISNASITTAAVLYNSVFQLNSAVITRNAMGLSVGVELELAIGNNTQVISMPVITAASLDSGPLTVVQSCVFEGVPSRIKLELSSALLGDFLNLDLVDGTSYTVTSTTQFLQSLVRVRPANPVELTVVTPSQAGLRYLSDPAPVRTTLSVASPVTLDQGYNAEVALDGNGGVQYVAGAGLGLGVYPICPEWFTPNAPPGITPVSNNINIVGDGCHPTYVMQHPDDPSTTKRLLVFGNCEACCSCDDYLNVLKAIEKLGIGWGLGWDRLGLTKAHYDFLKGKYDMVRKRLGKLTLNKGGYATVSLFKPNQIVDLSGVMQLYTSVSIYDPLYSDEVINDRLYSTLHIRSVTLTQVRIWVESDLPPHPKFIPNPNPAATNMALTLSHDDVSNEGVPFHRVYTPVYEAGDPSVLVIDNMDFPKISLVPGTNLGVDLVACVDSADIKRVFVSLKWNVEIAKASLDNPSYDANIINEDPKETYVKLLPEYVIPALS